MDKPFETSVEKGFSVLVWLTPKEAEKLERLSHASLMSAQEIIKALIEECDE